MMLVLVSSSLLVRGGSSGLDMASTRCTKNTRQRTMANIELVTPREVWKLHYRRALSSSTPKQLRVCIMPDLKHLRTERAEKVVACSEIAGLSYED
mmetsp:Transcript_72747/g.115129  ORF Transcript_72747/g.115129 Transcript_72747/m.115129 type:complete len:96 (+) Transcript_72747:530-817(+)